MAQIDNGNPPVEYRLITGRKQTIRTFHDADAFWSTVRAAMSKQAEAKAKALRNCTTDELLAELSARFAKLRERVSPQATR